MTDPAELRERLSELRNGLVDQIHQLHSAITVNGQPVCSSCGSIAAGHTVSWPCPTMQVVAQAFERTEEEA